MAAYNEIVQILGVTAAAYPNFMLLPETVRVYTEMLQDIPGDILGIAAKQLIAQSRFFPTVSELRDCSHQIMQGTSEIPTAFEAWENAMD